MDKTVWLALVPILAVFLDLALGDPRRLPHPVQLIGWWADRYETLARKLAGKSQGVLRVLGAIGAALTAAMAGGTAHAATLPGYLGPVLALYLAFAGLALRGLLKETLQVALLLETASLETARKGLSMLVSRDVQGLERQGVYRALAETVSENLNDAFVAPFFYLCLAGPYGLAALWAYKAVSTLDSMWGYKTKKWRAMGWAAARLDDVLAYVPARLTALFMMLAGWLMGFRPWGYWRDIRRDARAMESPNAGWPMAAAAWIMGAPLGGGAVYFGKWKDKPLLGPEEGEWGPALFGRLLRLVFWSGLAAALGIHLANLALRSL